MEENQLTKLLADLRLAVFDVDGVLTDGGIFLGENDEYKRFFIQDGLGLKMLMNAGVEVGLITARSSACVARRAKELNITHFFQGDKQKIQQLKELAASLDIAHVHVLYMGDDFHDLRCLKWAGVSAAPANAAREVLNRVDCITRLGGGNGAVREISERILKAKGLWEQMVEEFIE